MTKHLQALAKAKNFVKLHEPDPAFLEELAKREEDAENNVREKKFKKEQATSDVYREQREVAQKVKTAKAIQNYQ